MRRRGRPPHPDILTPREWDVLGLLREGLSNPEIADRLGIGRETVKHHVSEILGKLAVGSREEAARWSASGGRERRPWWSAALAPFALAARRVSAALPIKASWIAAVAAGLLFLVVIGGLALMTFLLVRGGDDWAGGGIERVSVSPSGEPGNSHSDTPAVSADGRFVAFASDADNLLADPLQGWVKRRSEVYVRDRRSGTTEIISVAMDGSSGSAGSGSPAISADGRYVAFSSGADNLAPDDTNGFVDVFIRDRKAGVTERVSLGMSGTESNDGCRSPTISADGRFVAFISAASNLVAEDTNGVQDVFVHDRETGRTQRVSVSSDGEEANGPSVDLAAPALSADGRYVAFTSSADNLVPDDTKRLLTPCEFAACPDGVPVRDVFVHDRTIGLTERVSISSDSAEADDHSRAPTISSDGRFVAFESLATNLVSGGSTAGCGNIHRYGHIPEPVEICPHVYVRDRDLGITERVRQVASLREESPAISADGRYVAFVSLGSTVGEILVHDRERGTDDKVGLVDFQYRYWTALAVGANARYVAFGSRLAPPFTDVSLKPERWSDVFIHDRGP